MIKIYGSDNCHRCVDFINYVKERGWEYSYITDQMEVAMKMQAAQLHWMPAIEFDEKLYSPQKFKFEFK